MKRGAGDDAGSSKKKKKISIKLKSGKSSSKEKGKKGKAKAEPPADELMQAILDQGGDIAEYERLKDVDTAEGDDDVMRFDDDKSGGGGMGEKELLSFIGGLGLASADGGGGSAAAPAVEKKLKKKLPKKERKAAAAAAAAAGDVPATDWRAEREARMLVKGTKKKAKAKAKAEAGSDDEDDDDEDDDDEDDEGAAAEHGSDNDLGDMDGNDYDGGRKQAKQHGIEVKSSETPISSLPQDKQTLVKELKKRMLVEPTGTWHEEAGAGAKTEEKAPVSVIAQAQERAAQLLIHETGYSEQLHTILRGGEETWMKTILKDGTLGDRLAAWMLRIQESPLHRLKALDTLLSMLTKRSKREALLAMDTLSELWLLTLLPDRKLVLFSARPLTVKMKKKEMDRHLILWQYEAELKARYQSFAQALDGLTHNNTEQIKNKALGVVYELLKGKPEQERALLATLCNKLGDPEKKVAAKARHLLAQLVESHPAMKTVVAKEVQHVLSRPNMEKKAQYQTICFLNQLELSRNDSNKLLARRLIEIYFQFFEIYVKKEELEAKMLSALLTGVNRAFPFADMEAGTFTTHIDTLFKVVHAGAFGCSIQALSLLLQVMDGKQAVSDRFFRAVYEKLLDPELLTSSKQAMFLNLVYRSMKADPAVNRVKSFVKRLLQVCAVMPANFVCGALLVVSEAADAKPSLKALLQLPEVPDDDEDFQDVKESDDDDDDDDGDADDADDADAADSDEETFKDAPDSDDEDSDEDNEAAKQFAQIAAIASEEEGGAAVDAQNMFGADNTHWLEADTSAIFATVDMDCKVDVMDIAKRARNCDYNPAYPGLVMRIREPRATVVIFPSGKMVCTGAASEELARTAAMQARTIVRKLDFEVRFKDFEVHASAAVSAGSDDDDADDDDGEAAQRKIDVAKIKAELAAAQAKTEESKQKKKMVPSVPKIAGKASQKGYDIMKREPLYSGAETTCLWEIVTLAKHYHPSVETFCATLRNGGALKYAGDPLRDFTSARFLERFVFKKPKKKKSDRGGSIMQPKDVAEHDVAMVNSDSFLKMKRKDVPVEERFFHTYFKQKKARSGVQEVEQSAEMDAAAQATAVVDDADDDLDFAAAFGINANGDEFDDDDVDAPAAAEGEEYDYDNIVDESDDEMEGELDLEAIAREGFDEEIAEDEDDETGGGTFAAAEDFEDLLDGDGDAGADKERARDLSKGMDAVRSAGQSNRKFRRKRGPGNKR